MLRLNDTIRLNTTEKESLRSMTGRPEVPATASEMNRQLDTAAADWRTTECAEGELLAVMADLMKAPSGADKP